MNKPKVFIAIPCVDGWVHAKVMQSIIRQMAGHELHFLIGVSPIGNARNTIVKNFLKSDCTHLWFVDDDTIPPDDALTRLLAMDCDIATGVTPILRKDGTISNVFPTTDATEQMTMEDVAKIDGTLNISGVGGSCILIARRVFEDPDNEFVKPPYYAALWFQDGNFVEEDIYFCNKASEDGYLIRLDPKVVCKHVKEVLI